MPSKLLNDKELEWSAVVANNSMNRERIACGINSYEQDIGFNPIQFIENRKKQESIQWTDLCCGRGNALIQTAKHFSNHQISPRIKLLGIDLVDYFSTHEPSDTLKLQVLNLTQWKPSPENDLVTIIHGLHYIGDKIDLIIRAIASLKPDGVFIGNLDLENIIIEGGSKNSLSDFFKKNDITYNHKKKLIWADGRREIKSRFRYLGADDAAGPNYTGQDVVSSYYELD